MVNETRSYSSLQNLPFNTQIGTVPATNQNSIILQTLPPGIYEIKFGAGLTGSLANNGQRQFVISGNIVFEWSGGAEPTLEHQETTLFIRSANPIIVQMARPGTVAAPGISYQLSWRSTPSLNLITKAELMKKNQEIIENLEQKWDKEYDEALKENQKGGGISAKTV